MHTVEERTWNEFWAKFWRVDHRHSIPHIHEWDKNLVEFIEHVCKLTPPMKILDLACGGGDQARHFARKGYHVIGIDLAPSLVEYADTRSKTESLNAEFVANDIYNIQYNKEFDACVVLGGSFGFHGPASDYELLENINRSLKPGGRLYISFRTVDRLFGKSQVWYDTPQGWLLCEEIYDEERKESSLNWYLVDSETRVIRFKNDSDSDFDRVIRCYTLDEMESMLTDAGFVSLDSYAGVEFTIPPKDYPPERLRSIITGIKP